MKRSNVEIHDDHLLVHLQAGAGPATLQRAVVVPYSTIEWAGVEAPHWPGVLDGRAAINVPGRLAVGSFREWTSGERRLLDIHKGTTQTLRLKLDGHPKFDEIEVDVPSPGEIVQAVAKRKPASTRSPGAKE